MGAGALQSTGNVLDVAIQGEGWFRVGPSTAPAVPTEFTYTRAGNFTPNTDGYLVTQDGNYVAGRTAAGGGTDTLIQIPTGATDVAIGQDGAVTYTPAGGPPRQGRLPLAGEVLQRGRPAARLGQPLAGVRLLGRRGRRHPRRDQPRLAPSPA